MWLKLWHEHRGSVAGLMIGLLLGFIYLLTGFWNMLVFAAIVFIAYFAGKHYTKLDSVLAEVAQRLLERFRK
jgi:hypothetical protein